MSIVYDKHLNNCQQHSPIFLDDGSIGGVFCAVSETTETIINERQLRYLSPIRTISDLIYILSRAISTLRQIAAHSVEAIGAANALSICAKTIESHSQYVLCPILIHDTNDHDLSVPL